MASFLDLFNATIGTITAAKNELIEIKSSVTVHDALQLMIAQQVTVLPIYQPPSGIDEPAAAFVSQGKEYLGMVTLNDIVTFIINVYLNEAERIDDCFRTSVYQIIGSSNESAIDRSLVIESEETPLSDLIDKFCQGVHHCIVFSGVDRNRFAPKLLTQTDVVRYLLDQIEIFPEVQAALSVDIASVISGDDLLSINENTTFVDALKHFKTHTAIPVVNESGQVVANFSTSDLKSIPIDETDWRRYGVMTVKQFLTKDIDGDYKRPPVCITTHGSLYTAAKYMIDHHIHRVWAISPVEVAGVQGFGVGCVSLTDVIRIVNNFSTVQP